MAGDARRPAASPSRRAPPAGRRAGTRADPVATARATIIASAEPLPDRDSAQAWLRGAGEDELTDGLLALNRMLLAFRRVAADPYAATVGRHQLIPARIGYGAGEQVADGRWEQARELPGSDRSRRRAVCSRPRHGWRRRSVPDRRLWSAEELALRARLDLDQDRPREASLQLLATLDRRRRRARPRAAALGLSERVAELRERRGPVGPPRRRRSAEFRRPSSSSSSAPRSNGSRRRCAPGRSRSVETQRRGDGGQLGDDVAADSGRGASSRTASARAVITAMPPPHARVVAGSSATG